MFPSQGSNAGGLRFAPPVLSPYARTGDASLSTVDPAGRPWCGPPCAVRVHEHLMRATRVRNVRALGSGA